MMITLTLVRSTYPPLLLASPPSFVFLRTKKKEEEEPKNNPERSSNAESRIPDPSPAKRIDSKAGRLFSKQSGGYSNTCMHYDSMLLEVGRSILSSGWAGCIGAGSGAGEGGIYTFPSYRCERAESREGTLFAYYCLLS